MSVLVSFANDKITDKINSFTSATFEYFTPTDKPYGLTYGQWTVKWWEWIWSIPDSNSPLRDNTGKNADVNQPEKDVWFLVGTWATETMLTIPTRKVTIPFGRSLLFPIINCEANPIEYPDLKTDEDIVNHVVSDENTIVLKEVYINNIGNTIQRVGLIQSCFHSKFLIEIRRKLYRNKSFCRWLLVILETIIRRHL